MSKIAERYLKSTKNQHAYSLKEDKYPINDWISTGNLALNTLISADPNKGIPTGRIIQFAGPASVGKSYVSAQVVIEAQKKGYTCFIFDTEGAGNREQWIQRGLDEDLTVHIPIVGINATRIEILTILEEIKKDDKAIIVVDSLGNLLSDKEMKDQYKDDAPVDMTKAKDLKKFFRQIAIELMVKNVPCIVVNHEYSSLDLYSRQVQQGGTGPAYNSSVIVSMSKSKEEEGSGTNKEIVGSGMRCTSVKNRMAREKMVVRPVIDYNKGLSLYSGLFDLAVSTGNIVSPKVGWYAYKEDIDAPEFDKENPKGWVTGKRKRDFNSSSSDIWETILNAGLREGLYEMFSYQSSAEGGVFDDSELVEENKEETEEPISTVIKKMKSKNDEVISSLSN